MSNYLYRVSRFTHEKVDTPDGKWYALLFQDNGAVGRIPVLVPVKWEDDWCIFGENGKVPHEMPLPVKGCETKSIVISDDFNSSSLALEWQWNHNPDNSFWSLTERNTFKTTGQECGINFMPYIQSVMKHIPLISR